MTMKKVLIIDDDKDLTDLYEHMFKKENFEVYVTNKGSDSLEIANKVKPDIIILDIVMPKIDGFEVFKAIRKDPTLKKTPVIVLSNLSQEEEIREAFAYKAAKYLIKAHYTPAEVVEQTKDVLKMK